MTAFKREARYRQSLWRERRGYARGFHLGRKDPDGNRREIPNGSRLHPRASRQELHAPCESP